MDSLAELYSLLQEEDMWAGLWQKRCKFPETATAIAYEQHGFFEQVSESSKHCCQSIGSTVLQINPIFMKMLFNVIVILKDVNCDERSF